MEKNYKSFVSPHAPITLTSAQRTSITRTKSKKKLRQKSYSPKKDVLKSGHSASNLLLDSFEELKNTHKHDDALIERLSVTNQVLKQLQKEVIVFLEFVETENQENGRNLSPL